MNNTVVSIVIPYYAGMENAQFFLDRCLKSIKRQSFKDYEVIVNEEGVVGHNINNGVRKAKGTLIHIMCMDDYFAYDDALKEIVSNCAGNIWHISGCSNNPNPYYTGDIHQGNNKLGGLSVITYLKEEGETFDESLVWLIDCDFYKRMYSKYGSPKILNGVHVVIGEGRHQTTNLLRSEIKRHEVNVLTERYA